MEKLSELFDQAKEMSQLHGAEWSSALCESGVGDNGNKHHAIISDSKNDIVIDTGSDSMEASWLCDYLELCSPANIIAIAEAFRDLEKLARNLNDGWLNAIAERDALASENSTLSRYFIECAKAVHHWNAWADPEDKLACAPETPATDAHLKSFRSETLPGDYFGSLVSKARISADKAMVKFPQPNYVLLKVAEEAGEVVQAGVHYAEGRMKWDQLEGEVVQLLAMLMRLVTEGDQVNGVTPPEICRDFKPAHAADLAELVPGERSYKDIDCDLSDFGKAISAQGWNDCRAAILRNIEDAGKKHE